MINMPIMKQEYKFSDNQLDAYQIGGDLVRRELFDADKEMFAKYARFSDNKLTLDQHNFAFLEELKKASYEKSGINPEKVGIEEAVRYDTFNTAMFTVMESIIDSLTTRNEIEDILTFVELRNQALGDSMLIDIKNPNAYVFSKAGRGKKHTYLQTRFGEDVTLTPAPRKISIKYNLKDIVTGRVNIGREMARMVRGMRTAWLQDLSTLIFSTTVNPINNKVISTGNFTEANFRSFEQNISAYNGSRNTVVYGTRSALSNLLPADTLRYQLGNEYMDRGYISTAFGTRAIELYQAVRADSTPMGGIANINLILPEDYVILASTDVQRPVVLALGGGVRISEENEQDSQTEDRIITITQDYDLKLASQGIIGVFRTSS